MDTQGRRVQVGVMGARDSALSPDDRARLAETAERLGAAIARNGCTLVTGATTGLPDMVGRAARRHGGLTVGISPAMHLEEHVGRYGLPPDAADVMIYTGFGLKGRNVINIRASDIVIIFGGGMGTLNEFTIAYDEGKVIGVLEGSGGIADHLKELESYARKPALSCVVFDNQPEELLAKCLNTLMARK